MTIQNMILLVGLGNPGEQYKTTRHNAGWLFLDYLKSLPKSDFEEWKEKKRLNAFISEGSMNVQTLGLSNLQTPVVLAKPATFMNESGLAVQKIVTRYALRVTRYCVDLIVVHDDMDIPFGEYKIQTNRGSAGHHGVESIIEHLKTKNFTRIRIGISPTKHFDEQIKTARASGHVLKRFSITEQNELKKVFRSILEKLTAFLSTK